jgi:hypothetical protein
MRHDEFKLGARVKILSQTQNFNALFVFMLSVQHRSVATRSAHSGKVCGGGRLVEPLHPAPL